MGDLNLGIDIAKLKKSAGGGGGGGGITIDELWSGTTSTTFTSIVSSLTHPLDDYKDALKRVSKITISDILEAAEDEMSKIHDGDIVTVAGIITARKNSSTRNGQMMAFVTMEDLTASAEVIVFPKVLAGCDSFLNSELPIVLTGRVSVKEDEEAKIIAERIGILQNIKTSRLMLEISREDEKLLDIINPIIYKYRGDDEISVTTTYDKKTYTCIPRVKVCEQLINEISAVLGKGKVKKIEE